MKADHDPLASHIFISRRRYRNAHDTKSGKGREAAARLSYSQACALGFRARFGEWEQLMGATLDGKESFVFYGISSVSLVSMLSEASYSRMG